MCKDIEPPLLPVSVASGPFKIVMIVPTGLTISKIALKYCMPKFNAITSPVEERLPSEVMLIVPPVLP